MTEMNNYDVNTQIMQEFLKEKRTDRRWRNIRFALWFILFSYVAIGIFTLFNGSSVPTTGRGEKYVALLRLDGMIAPGRDFSAENIVPLLQDAFTDKTAAGVIIDINSPGGTPVQAAIIHDAIIAFKKRYKKKIIVVGEDMLTSGAYYIAVAADKIYVNPNSLTGSVGVVMKGFGFVEIMKKMGIERRVYTAGTQKDRLDPFLPQNPEDLKKIQVVMAEVHQNFIQAVMDGRKGKLKADAITLFNGDFWSGQTALKLGLVDGLGNLLDVMEKEFKVSQYKEYGETSSFLRMLGGQLGSAVDTALYTYT